MQNKGWECNWISQTTYRDDLDFIGSEPCGTAAWRTTVAKGIPLAYCIIQMGRSKWYDFGRLQHVTLCVCICLKMRSEGRYQIICRVSWCPKDLCLHPSQMSLAIAGPLHWVLQVPSIFLLHNSTGLMTTTWMMKMMMMIITERQTLCWFGPSLGSGGRNYSFLPPVLLLMF